MSGLPGGAAKLLWDARDAAERIARFTADRSFDDYLSDEMLRAAVERQFEIIGEALGNLRRIDATLAGAIPNVGRIIAFRNVLIHSYATIDDGLVWGVVEGELPQLIQILARMLD
jgi:uncharacterized protein with HEPN domain